MNKWHQWMIAFEKWDDLRPTSKCLHCRGTGKCDDNNDCGFCYPDTEYPVSECEICGKSSVHDHNDPDSA